MINLSGAYENSKKCLETVADMILNTAYIIREDKNKNIFLCDNVIFSYNNSTDQVFFVRNNNVYVTKL